MRGKPRVIDLSKAYPKEEAGLAREEMFQFVLTEKRVLSGPRRKGKI